VELIRHLMDQHGLTRVDMAPILGTPSRVSEVLRGKKGPSMARGCARASACRPICCLPPAKHAPARRGVKQAAA
jgi:hypothetical protein